MDRLSEQVAEARNHLAEPAWNEARALAVLGRLQKARRPRAKQWNLRIFAFALAPIAAMFVLLVSLRKPTAPPSAALVLHDGSRALALGSYSKLSLTEDTDHSAVLSLQKGQGRFEVVPNKARRFRVQVGKFSVEALGTAFTVDRVSPQQVRVAVVVGHVAVSWPDGRGELWQGQEHLYPDDLVLLPPKANAIEPNSKTDSPKVSPPFQNRRESDWRQLARQKSFARAFDAMRLSGPHAVRDIPDELLMAADVARRAGHPEVAELHLSRIVQVHSKDPRSSVAAFTLGRVLIQRGASSQAATAFERAYSLQPTGALAEDALARAAFAWKSAKDERHLRVTVDRYTHSFPNGRQLEELKRLVNSP